MHMLPCYSLYFFSIYIYNCFFFFFTVSNQDEVIAAASALNDYSLKDVYLLVNNCCQV